MKIKVSAPGKLMLLGEHAVVYGHPCLVTAVDKRLYVEVEKIESTDDIINTPQVKECRFVTETIKTFRSTFKIKKSDALIHVKTNGDFTHRVGLGSSSAVTVATFQALANLFQIPLSKKELFNASYKVTLAIQGVGSGFDIASAVYGRTLYFVTGGKTIEQLAIEKLPLVVGYSGVKADTPTIVRNLKSRIQNSESKFPLRSEASKIQNVFEEILQLVNKGRQSIVRKDWEKLGSLLTENHHLLKELSVSTDKLDRMCEAAMKAGAWGAKLSGAGGGDCMIALVSPQKRKEVEKAIESVSGEIIHVSNNAEGVRIEE